MNQGERRLCVVPAVLWVLYATQRLAELRVVNSKAQYAVRPIAAYFHVGAECNVGR